MPDFPPPEPGIEDLVHGAGRGGHRAAPFGAKRQASPAVPPEGRDMPAAPTTATGVCGNGHAISGARGVATRARPPYHAPP